VGALTEMLLKCSILISFERNFILVLCSSTWHVFFLTCVPFLFSPWSNARSHSIYISALEAVYSVISDFILQTHSSRRRIYCAEGERSHISQSNKHRSICITVLQTIFQASLGICNIQLSQTNILWRRIKGAARESEQRAPFADSHTKKGSVRLMSPPQQCHREKSKSNVHKYSV